MSPELIDRAATAAKYRAFIPPAVLASLDDHTIGRGKLAEALHDATGKPTTRQMVRMARDGEPAALRQIAGLYGYKEGA